MENQINLKKIIKTAEPSGLPIELVAFIRTQLRIDTFIETGTGLGRTSNIARQLFDKVYTIEVHEGRYKEAKERFKDDKNVNCILGESPEALNTILFNLGHERAVIFLDAHCAYRQPVTDDVCPLLREIATVRVSNCEHVIIVDDIQFIAGVPPRREQWNAYPELVEVVNAFDPALRFVFIEGRCLVAVPRLIENDVRDFMCEARYDLRKSKV